MTPLDALEKARAAAKAKREAGEETPRLSPIEASQADPKSRAKAIKAKCYECMGGREWLRFSQKLEEGCKTVQQLWLSSPSSPSLSITL